MKSQEQNQKTNKKNQKDIVMYEIKVKGILDSTLEDWFEGITISYEENSKSDNGCTIISGYFLDQAELHGLLAKIRDLNLELLSVKKKN